MNKTWLAVEVQYFKFIGQIPCNSHEYDTCNTSRSRGRGGRSGCPWWISSTVRLKTEVRHQGHNQLPAHLAMSEGAAGVQVKEQTVSVTDAGSLVPLLFAYWAGGLEATSQGNNPACTSLLNFSPISHTRPIDEEFFSNSQPCLGRWPPDLCLISSPDADRDPYSQLSLA